MATVSCLAFTDANIYFLPTKTRKPCCRRELPQATQWIETTLNHWQTQEVVINDLISAYFYFQLVHLRS